MRSIMSGVLVLLAVASVGAHVTVSPREAAPSATQRYTVHVPTEGQVATVSVELEVPPGVTVTEVPSGPDFKGDARRERERIVAIAWTREIKPRESADFVFVARNPGTAGEIVWKAHQRFADGTSADWTGVAGDRRPASITKIGAAQNAPAHQH